MFKGFVLPLKQNTPNRAPSVSNISAAASSSGNISVSGSITDPDGDPINQLDAWLVDANGTAVPKTMKRLVRSGITIPDATHGTLYAPSFSFSWSASELATSITSSGTHQVKLKGYDTRGGIANASSTSFYYTKPVPATPELDIFQSTTAIPNYGNLSSFSAYVGNSTTRYITLRNTGKANLYITNYSSSNSRFYITNPASFNIVPGSSVSLGIGFKPTAKGTTTGLISISNNDSNENPYYIYVTGQGL